MSRLLNRRVFLQSIGVVASTTAVVGCGGVEESESAAASSAEAPTTFPRPLFRISLAQWSLHRAHFGRALEQSEEEIARAFREEPRSMLQGALDPLDFPATARELGIDAVEYVNTFFFDRAQDEAYLADLKSRCEAEGVSSLLIMCDNEGALGAPDSAARERAVENHRKWAETAAFLGCHSIRVNAASRGDYQEQQKLAADGLRRLCEVADGIGVDVLVENHGGLSSNGAWLAGVMELVGHPRVGTLPDFGNFQIGEDEWYDRYRGVAELMPYAKAVSAKSFDFDAEGNDTVTDFRRMMKIVLDAGYHGWVGIEYEGGVLPERQGIVATRELLKRVREELASGYREA